MEDYDTNLQKTYKGNIHHMNAYMWCYLNNRLNKKQLEKFQYIFGDNKDPRQKGYYIINYIQDLEISRKKYSTIMQ